MMLRIAGQAAPIQAARAGDETVDSITVRAKDMMASGAAPASVMHALDGYRDDCDPPMTRARLAEIIGQQLGARERARRVGVTMPPLETPTLTGRRYAWQDAGVSITIERVVSAREKITAEIVVDTDPDVLPDSPPRVHGPVRCDLLSTRDRDGLARYLDKRLPHNWTEILESSFRLAIEAHRTGEPAVRLADPIEDDDGGYAIDRLVVEGDPTMVFARGGSGKSWLALAIAAALDGAPDVLPLRCNSRHRVLYLDWEWRRAPHYRRLAMMVGKDGMDASGIIYRRMSGGLTGQVDQIGRMIAEHGITYLVVDSLGMACGNDPEKAEVVLPFLTAVRALGLGSLWVTHLPKGAAPDVDSPFGSTYWRDGARAAWRVDCQSQPDDPVMRLALHQCKLNEGVRSDPIGLSLVFADGRVKIGLLNVATTPVLQDAIPPQRRIMAALTARGAQSVAELQVLTGLDAKKIQMELDKMAVHRTAVQLSSGKWGLTAPQLKAKAGHANGVQSGYSPALLTGAQIAEELPGW